MLSLLFIIVCTTCSCYAYEDDICLSRPMVITDTLDDVVVGSPFWVFGDAFFPGQNPSPSTLTAQATINSINTNLTMEILDVHVENVTSSCACSVLVVIPQAWSNFLNETLDTCIITLTRIDGMYVSTVVGNPNVDWITPYIYESLFLRESDSAKQCPYAIYGRNLDRLAHNISVSLVSLGYLAQSYAMKVLASSESRICFSPKTKVLPGRYSMTLCGGVGEKQHCIFDRDKMETTVVSQPNENGIIINASDTPYNLDPTGQTDVSEMLKKAMLDATENGTKPNGRVVVGAGTYLLDPRHGVPSNLHDVCAICYLNSSFKVTLQGAGMNNTIFVIGIGSDAGFYAAEVSLMDLTLQDVQSTSYSVNGTSIRALWSMVKLAVIPRGQATPQNSTGSTEGALYTSTDMVFRRVRFIAHRVGTGLSLRYMKRVTVEQCEFIGGNLNAWGPLHDLHIYDNTGKMSCGGWGTTFTGLACGSFVEMPGWGGSGHASDVTMIGNTIAHLQDKSESRFPGRSFVGQNYYLRRFYFANNINMQAGPGDLSNGNMGEQVLLEVGAGDNTLKVDKVNGTYVTLKRGTQYNIKNDEDVFSAYLTRLGEMNDGSTIAACWSYFKGIGTFHIQAGNGAGQYRTVIGMEGNDTVILNKPFVSHPDATSIVMLTISSVQDIIIRDNVFNGLAKEHVTQQQHVATTAIFLWGNTFRYSAINNTAHWIRYALDMFAYGNSSSVDVLIKSTTAENSRIGLEMNIPQRGKANGFCGLVIRETTLNDTYESAINMSPACKGNPCLGPSGFAVIVDGMHSSNAPSAISLSTPQYGTFSESFGLSQALITNSAFTTSEGNMSDVGIWKNITAGLEFAGETVEGYESTIKGKLPLQPKVLIRIPFIQKQQTTHNTKLWVVVAENSGLVTADFVLTLPTGVTANTTYLQGVEPLGNDVRYIALEGTSSNRSNSRNAICGKMCISSPLAAKSTSCASFCLKP
eukprot:m.347571 g.347571  ORF g.347571 m.347571 type:complete len:976 (-) comp33540_c0_seq1:46-2973(-)